MITPMKNKYIVRSRITEAKFRLILLYVSTSLMLVALQEVWTLNPLKYPKSLIFQKGRYVKSLSKFKILIAKECEKLLKCKAK